MRLSSVRARPAEPAPTTADIVLQLGDVRIPYKAEKVLGAVTKLPRRESFDRPRRQASYDSISSLETMAFFSLAHTKMDAPPMPLTQSSNYQYLPPDNISHTYSRSTDSSVDNLSPETNRGQQRPYAPRPVPSSSVRDFARTNRLSHFSDSSSENLTLAKSSGRAVRRSQTMANTTKTRGLRLDLSNLFASTKYISPTSATKSPAIWSSSSEFLEPVSAGGYRRTRPSDPIITMRPPSSKKQLEGEVFDPKTTKRRPPKGIKNWFDAYPSSEEAMTDVTSGDVEFGTHELAATEVRQPASGRPRRMPKNRSASSPSSSESKPKHSDGRASKQDSVLSPTSSDSEHEQSSKANILPPVQVPLGETTRHWAPVPSRPARPTRSFSHDSPWPAPDKPLPVLPNELPGTSAVRDSVIQRSTLTQLANGADPSPPAIARPLASRVPSHVMAVTEEERQLLANMRRQRQSRSCSQGYPTHPGAMPPRDTPCGPRPYTRPPGFRSFTVGAVPTVDADVCRQQPTALSREEESRARLDRFLSQQTAPPPTAVHPAERASPTAPAELEADVPVQHAPLAQPNDDAASVRTERSTALIGLQLPSTTGFTTERYYRHAAHTERKHPSTIATTSSTSNHPSSTGATLFVPEAHDRRLSAVSFLSRQDSTAHLAHLRTEAHAAPRRRATSPSPAPSRYRPAVLPADRGKSRGREAVERRRNRIRKASAPRERTTAATTEITPATTTAGPSNWSAVDGDVHAGRHIAQRSDLPSQRARGRSASTPAHPHATEGVDSNVDVQAVRTLLGMHWAECERSIGKLDARARRSEGDRRRTDVAADGGETDGEGLRPAPLRLRKVRRP